MKMYNNKSVAFILAGLIVLFTVISIIRLRNNPSNLQPLLLVDTSSVAMIKLYPYTNRHKEVVLSRKNNTWMVSNGGDIEDFADTYLVKGLLGVLPNLYADRIIANRKDQWSTYKMNDSSTTRVLVLDAQNNTLADYRVHEGPKKSGYAGAMVSDGTHYIRLQGDDNVYLVESYLNIVPDFPFENWRDHTILKLDQNKIASIVFPGLDNHILVKRNDVWMIDGKQADSVNTEAIRRYLGELQTWFSWSFEDRYRPSGPPDAQLKIEGTTGQLAVVNAWKKNDSIWVVNSSQRQGGYFAISDNELRKGFLPGIK